MSKNIKRIMKLNDLISLDSRRKHTIVLNPEENENIEDLDEDIVYDKTEWKITDEYTKFIEDLSKNDELSIEEKILKIYEKIGMDYIYDDNLISFIKKVDDDTFTVPDWYGRDVDEEWEKNRETHNRRNCFELARYLGKSLTELLKDNEDYSISINWNKELTHYFVGLTCNDYSLILDLDDFFNIKDLTRLKTGLTIQGIKILEDKENKFANALEKFNEGRSEYATKKIEHEVEGEDLLSHHNNEIDDLDNEEILFIKKALKILSEKHNLDSQGIFEYIKEIVDIKLGSDKREKVWKEIAGESKDSTRYIRCLIINLDNEKYLIDVDDKIVRLFSEEEFEEKGAVFIPYNELSRGGRDYDGT